MRISQLLPTFFQPRKFQAPTPSTSLAGDRLSLSTAPRLGGAFLQLDASHNTEAPGTWDARLSRMKAAGMDTVVIQYSAHNGEDLGPAVERVLDAAEKVGMKVWLGTPLEERAWWKQSWSPFFLRSVIPQVEKETFETVSRWAKHPALGGIYLPYETNGVGDPWAMGDFLGAMSRAAKKARPDLPVMISPYTNLVPGVALSLPSFVLKAWWNVVLSRAQIDVLAWQDGVGAVTAQIDRVEHDLGALAAAAKKHGVALWANVEAFQRTTPLNQAFSATAADMGRFEKQLQAVAPYAERIISFDFNHYMDPEAGEDAAKLYQAYMKKTTTP